MMRNDSVLNYKSLLVTRIAASTNKLPRWALFDSAGKVKVTGVFYNRWSPFR